MMNTKKLVVLAAILVVAVGIIVVSNMLSNQKPSEKSLQFFPGISEKTIGAVILKDATDMVKLQRKGDVWVMVPKQVLQSASSAETQTSSTGVSKTMEAAAPAVIKTPAGLAAAEFPADSTVVGQLLQNIVMIKKNTLVSENQAKQEMFEVDSGHGIRIEAFDLAGKSLGVTFLGKSGPDYNTSYCRAEKSNAVYLVQGLARWAFSAEHKRWTNKSIMKFEKGAVKQITIARKGAPAIEIAKGDTATMGWQLVAPVKKNADSNKVNEILNDLSNLSAAEYEDSAYTDSETGLADPSITVTVSFLSGTVRAFAIGNKKPGQSNFWCRVPEKQYLFLIGDDLQKKFDKKPDEFLEAKPGTKPIVAVPAPIPEKYRKAHMAPPKK
jgi:hypothetical protein